MHCTKTRSAGQPTAAPAMPSCRTGHQYWCGLSCILRNHPETGRPLRYILNSAYGQHTQKPNSLLNVTN